MRFLALLFAMFASLVALPSNAQSQILPNPNRPTPPSPDDKTNLWYLDLSSGGRVIILLRPDVAPQMVERVKTLTRDKFYDGTVFHRVLDEPYPIAQGGDPTGSGTGDSPLPNVPAEFNYLPHVRGTVSAARRGAPDRATPEQEKEAENSANSQFYIMLAPFMAFDQKYTVFGRVIGGMEWVDKIQRGEPPANPTRIVHAWIASDNPPPYENAPAAAPAPAEGAVVLPVTPPAE